MITTDIKVLLTTTPNLGVAKPLAERAIHERLAACASFIGGLESVYWWKGQIETSSEVLVLFKTHASKVDELAEFIRKHHPYETPEIISLSVERASEKYARWIEDSIFPEPGPAGSP